MKTYSLPLLLFSSQLVVCQQEPKQTVSPINGNTPKSFWTTEWSSDGKYIAIACWGKKVPKIRASAPIADFAAQSRDMDDISHPSGYIRMAILNEKLS